ncbi:protein NRT1/ PTR FAMILY 5.10 isoform X2 [Cryptomeria japonica]|uniref:protein NRT1/ PTR FAMILY 5.10 isoform X2 n=1 Tax=Cryptomeria japonica TaxID=3369 RepID=UPI0027DA0AE0|nr:protein NRT1/ PTR FAMILY 5.10 isoform X2 [Cryptomeria japonica]
MEELLLSDEFVKDGSVDLHGHSVIRSHTGTWKASLLIIGVEIGERFAYAGILSNLVTYLTTVLNESTASAASSVNIWSGVAFMLPFLGAFVADSYLGVTVLTYIQDNVGWGLGFGIPAFTMAMALVVFLCGTRFYRNKLPSGSSLTRVIHVFVAAFFKRNDPIPFREPNQLASIQEVKVLRTESRRQLLQTNKFRFLDKATIEDELDFECRTTRNWRLCTVQQVEEVKLLLGMLPIWMACLMYGIVVAQSFTFFTKQGSTMDRKIGRHFVIPSASMQCFNSISVMLFVPVYDRLFVPIAKRLSGKERGITLLQRIGIGMFFSAISMIVAAGIETKRLKAAKDNGLIDMPYATIPISIFWLLPEYVLFGMADVFVVVGMQEYFYDQMPDTMKSLGIALYLSVLGVGSFLSSILILVIEKVTCRKQEQCWFADNLNKAHLDYFYWLLAALSLLNLGMFMTLASCYKYKKVAPSGTENST